MTILSNYSETTYSCNGVTKTFTIPWKFFDDEISIYKNKSFSYYTKGEDYTIINNGDGGEVTFNEAPAAGSYITITRAIPLYQLIKFLEGEDFPAEDYEYALDRIYMAIQELSQKIKRCWEIAPGEEEPSQTLENYLYHNSQESFVWDSSIEYRKNQIIQYGDSSYICKAETSKGENPISSSNWQQIARSTIYDIITQGNDITAEGELRYYPVSTWGGLTTGDTYFKMNLLSGSIVPTINAATGKLTVPGGITDVYNKSEIDNMIGDIETALSEV